MSYVQFSFLWHPSNPNYQAHTHTQTHTRTHARTQTDRNTNVNVNDTSNYNHNIHVDFRKYIFRLLSLLTRGCSFFLVPLDNSNLPYGAAHIKARRKKNYFSVDFQQPPMPTANVTQLLQGRRTLNFCTLQFLLVVCPKAQYVMVFITSARKQQEKTRTTDNL